MSMEKHELTCNFFSSIFRQESEFNNLVTNRFVAIYI